MSNLLVSRMPLSASARSEFAAIADVAPFDGRPLLVASAHPLEGATTVAIALARSLAQDARVLLIDADVRHPERGPLRWSKRQEELSPLRTDVENLRVLSGACMPEPPVAFFEADAFREARTVLAKEYDEIVVDTAPVLEHPDAIEIARHARGVVLVADAGHTRADPVLIARERIESVGGRVLGVVLNRRRYYIPESLYRLL